MPKWKAGCANGSARRNRHVRLRGLRAGAGGHGLWGLVVKQPPYTTRSGLRIGCEYRPAQRPQHDEDALRLQEALIAPRRRYTVADAAYDLTWAAALMALAAVAGLLAGYLIG